MRVARARNTSRSARRRRRTPRRTCGSRSGATWRLFAHAAPPRAVPSSCRGRARQRRELRGDAERPRLFRLGVHLVDELPLLRGHRAAHDRRRRARRRARTAGPAGTVRRASRSMEATRNPNAAARAEPSAMREGGRALEARVQAFRERLHQPKRLAQREGQRLRRRRRRRRRHGRGGYDGTSGFETGWAGGKKVRTRARGRGTSVGVRRPSRRRGPPGLLAFRGRASIGAPADRVFDRSRGSSRAWEGRWPESQETYPRGSCQSSSSSSLGSLARDRRFVACRAFASGARAQYRTRPNTSTSRTVQVEENWRQ